MCFFQSRHCSWPKTYILWPCHSASPTAFSLFNILFIHILSREAHSSLGMKKAIQWHKYLSIGSHSFIHSTIQLQLKQLLHLASSGFQSRGEDKYGNYGTGALLQISHRPWAIRRCLWAHISEEPSSEWKVKENLFQRSGTSANIWSLNEMNQGSVGVCACDRAGSTASRGTTCAKVLRDKTCHTQGTENWSLVMKWERSWSRDGGKKSCTALHLPGPQCHGSRIRSALKNKTTTICRVWGDDLQRYFGEYGC